MNTLNEEDDDTSKGVHELARGIVTDNARHEILAGSHYCADNNGYYTALRNFLGTLILQCNIQTEVAPGMTYTNTDLITQ